MGLSTESFNMVGIPYDSPNTVLDTIKLNAAIKVDKMQVSIYQPYKGTRLADLCKKNKYIVSMDLEPDWFAPTLKLDTISSDQVLMFRDYFKVLVRYYQFIGNMPRYLSRMFIKISDMFFETKKAAVLLNTLYIPLNYVFRKTQLAKVKFNIAKIKILYGDRS